MAAATTTTTMAAEEEVAAVAAVMVEEAVRRPETSARRKDIWPILAGTIPRMQALVPNGINHLAVEEMKRQEPLLIKTWKSLSY